MERDSDFLSHLVYLSYWLGKTGPETQEPITSVHLTTVASKQNTKNNNLYNYKS